MEDYIREDINLLTATIDEVVELAQSFIEKAPKLKAQLEAMETDDDFYEFGYEYSTFEEARDKLCELTF